MPNGSSAPRGETDIPAETPERLTGTDTWSGRDAVQATESILFEELFRQHLPPGSGKRCFEVGCVPGSFMAYLGRELGYMPEGIDFVPGTVDVVSKTLRNYGLEEFRVYQGDFFAWEPRYSYELVLSLGFIEHFQGALLDDVVKRTVDLVKPGGFLFLEVPNFNHGQYWLHKYLDRRNFDLHNIDVMSTDYFQQIAARFELDPVFLGYYGGPFQFWGEKQYMAAWQKPLHSLLRRIGKICWKLFGNTANNRFFSPYLVMVARKR